MDPPTEHMPDLEARPHSYRERKLAHSGWAAVSTIPHLCPEGVGAQVATSAKFLWTEKREGCFSLHRIISAATGA